MLPTFYIYLKLSCAPVSVFNLLNFSLQQIINYQGHVGFIVWRHVIRSWGFQKHF